MKSKPLFTFLISFCNLLPIISNAQSVLFDFDNAPLHTSFPISLTVSGLTARFSATGHGYSIQDNTAPVVPVGFSGRYIYPNSVYLADLLISFDQPLDRFSIWYSPQELACDTSATMRVTAYMKGNYVGTNTKIASTPGTWPVDSLTCIFLQGFDSVVVHFDSHPPMCQDWGPIFLADNMRVSVHNATGFQNPETSVEKLVILSNPVSQKVTISFSLQQTQRVNITVYAINGRVEKNIFEGTLSAGEHQLNWEPNNNVLAAGVYFLQMSAVNFSRTCKLIVGK